MLRSLCSQGKEGELSLCLRLVILQSPAGGLQFCQAFPETHPPSTPLSSDLLASPLCSSKKRNPDVEIRPWYESGSATPEPYNPGQYLDLTGLLLLRLCNGNNHGAGSVKAMHARCPSQCFSWYFVTSSNCTRHTVLCLGHSLLEEQRYSFLFAVSVTVHWGNPDVWLN